MVHGLTFSLLHCSPEAIRPYPGPGSRHFRPNPSSSLLLLYPSCHRRRAASNRLRPWWHIDVPSLSSSFHTIVSLSPPPPMKFSTHAAALLLASTVIASPARFKRSCEGEKCGVYARGEQGNLAGRGLELEGGSGREKRALRAARTVVTTKSTLRAPRTVAATTAKGEPLTVDECRPLRRSHSTSNLAKLDLQPSPRR